MRPSFWLPSLPSLFPQTIVRKRQVPPSLMTLFAFVAAQERDASASPALELLFILAKPEDVPVREAQLLACSLLLEGGRPPPDQRVDGGGGSGGGGSPSLWCLRHALINCLAHATHPSASDAVDGSGGNGSSVGVGGARMADPARMIRLVEAVCEGGNEEVANTLAAAAGLSIDATCAAVVRHLEQAKDAAQAARRARSSSGSSSGATVASAAAVAGLSSAGFRATSLSTVYGECDEGPLVGDELEDAAEDHNGGGSGSGVGRVRLSPEATLRCLTAPGSVGSALFGLLVEQIFLLPLNSDQMASGSLWACLAAAAVPCLEALAALEAVPAALDEFVTDLVDLLEHVFVTLVRLGLFEAALENPAKEQILSELADDVETLLSKRQEAPEHLRSAFLAECEAQGTDQELGMEAFVKLVHKLTVAAGSDASPRPSGSEAAEAMSLERRTFIERAFVDADLDGNGLVDLYVSGVLGKGGAKGRSIVLHCESGILSQFVRCFSTGLRTQRP